MQTVSSKNFATKGDLGYIPLEEALEQYSFESLIFYDNEDEDEETKEQRYKLFQEIDELANKYLNIKELCIYNLVIHENKKTSDIVEIMNYNSWRTTQNSIERVFKILKLYYEFSKIDQEDLSYEITRNFSKFEQKILKFLEDRLTIQQINEKLGKKKFCYTKTHSLIKNIMSRLDDMGGSCRQFYNFLSEIRKFKDSCNFDEKVDNIKILNGGK
ncbi:MAG: hypothetical protein K0Q47_98 [Sedimentibacter sp.]|jgi:hypothetical protein|nr:hypothetical protein [Sedimentibacter sp.]